MRATRKQLRARAEMLNRLHGFELNIDGNIGGVRVESANGSRDISPRYSSHEMDCWLGGFMACVRELERNGIYLENLAGVVRVSHAEAVSL